MNHSTRQLAQRLESPHNWALNRQERASDRVAAIVDHYYRDLFRIIGAHMLDIPRLVRDVHDTFIYRLSTAYVNELSDLLIESHDATRSVLLRSVPFRVQDRLLVNAVRRQAGLPIVAFEAIAFEQNAPARRINPELYDLRFTQQLKRISDATKKKLYEQFVFPPMSKRLASAIVNHQHMLGRIAPLTQLAPPETIGSLMIQGTSAGETRGEIIKRLEPLVNNVKSSARRVARTAGALIANEAQFAAFQHLGDVLIGYQAHAVKDVNSRPWHAARDLVIYYIHPKPGQKGLRQMPRPPYEPDDPNERPPGEPQLAHNCRCRRSPVVDFGD